jgi:general L-amino acid transport system permease protein
MFAARIRTGTRPSSRMKFAWSDPAFRGVIWQVLAVVVAVTVVWWLVDNTRHNLEVRRIASGFGFLEREAGLPIAEHLIPYSPVDTYFRALLVGTLNTLRVAAIGIVLARNWLLAKLAALYVEVVRDLPLLLQLLLLYTLVQNLPGPRRALNPVDGVYLSNRGLVLPEFEWMPAQAVVIGAFFLGCLGTFAYHRWALKWQMADGRPRRVWPVALALIAALPVLVSYALDVSWTLRWPALRGFNIEGGLVLSPEYFTLLVGLVVYTAAFIAEIVRSGILAVQKGQWEAAQALGFSRRMTLRLIVLPQALRVIIPPMTSQYLNLTKNSSLAVAIGYQDIVSIANTTINQTGQAVEAVAIIMAVYLAISLSISLFMNWYNRRIALTER